MRYAVPGTATRPNCARERTRVSGVPTGRRKRYIRGRGRIGPRPGCGASRNGKTQRGDTRRRRGRAGPDAPTGLGTGKAEQKAPRNRTTGKSLGRSVIKSGAKTNGRR